MGWKLKPDISQLNVVSKAEREEESKQGYALEGNLANWFTGEEAPS